MINILPTDWVHLAINFSVNLETLILKNTATIFIVHCKRKPSETHILRSPRIHICIEQFYAIHQLRQSTHSDITIRLLTRQIHFERRMLVVHEQLSTNRKNEKEKMFYPV